MSHANRFSPETPLGLDVQAILLDAPQGLSVANIRRRLRRKGRTVNEENLRTLLSHRSVFRLLPNDSYGLASDTTPLKDESHTTTEEQSRSIFDSPLLEHLLNAQTDYVVFDLETTGIDPQRDKIIQIAALKVVAGQPVAIENWYVNPAPAQLAYTLQLKLGMIEQPHIATAIANAPAIDAVLPKFLAFVGDLPLVAHNARFDARFLQQAASFDVPNVFVDSLEAALLLFPSLDNHQLATVAEIGLKLSLEEIADEWRQSPLNDASHEIGRNTLHNAITDVYVLFRAYQLLLARISDTDSDWIRVLLPELFGQTYQGVDEDIFEAQRNRCHWTRQHSTGPSNSAETMLRSHLEQKGYKPRAGQVEMQHLLSQALCEQTYAMIEAPTGTGKTLAYLTAAIEQARAEGMPIALSTAYRNLQDQLIGEIDAVAQSQVATFSSQLLKGVGNYLCWSRLARYLEEGDPNREKTRTLSLAERYVLAVLGRWLPESKNGTVDEIPYWLRQTFPVAESVIHQLRASAACSPNVQPHCSKCPMPAAYDGAKSADILIINHALWLSDSPRMPAFARLILDEAHTLEDVATEALTDEVSSNTLKELLHHAFDPFTERGVLPRLIAGTQDKEVLSAARGAINSLRRVLSSVEVFGPYMVQFIRRCTSRVDPRYGASYRMEAPPWKIHGTRWHRLRDAHRQLFDLHLSDLLRMLFRVREAAADSHSIRYREATLRDLTTLWESLAEQKQLAFDLIKVADTKQVFWLEVGPPRDPDAEERDPQPQWWALKAAPIDVGEALQPFYDKLDSAAFVSATLALRGSDFSYFIERLGLKQRLKDQFVRQLPPALPYKDNVLLGLVDYLTHVPMQHTLESFKEELSSEFTQLLQLTTGRALELFTARARMEHVAAQIEHPLAENGIPLYVQTAGSSRKQLLQEFVGREEAVLFGLRSFWEGVDAPGRTLSFVLMEKLPFPLLIAPVHRARAEQLVERGQSEFGDYMLPLMLLQFKQGFGRLLRRETDQGAVLLFDRRIHRKQYKFDLLTSLPGFLPRDESAEKSRRRFYERLVTQFPHLFNDDALAHIAALPKEIQLNFEKLLDTYLLPNCLDDYDAWRSHIVAALKAIFQFEQFRTINGIPAQEEVIRTILEGRDVIGILPTGAGKSLTFQLTALLRDGVTLVFSPLIALMRDQIAGLQARGIEVVGAIYSGQSASERDDVLERMRMGRARLVYISPERLRDPRLLVALQSTNMIQMVVDEAHCVDMWGASFRPDFLYLPRLFDVIGHRPPVAALTATATPEMQATIAEALQMTRPHLVVAPLNRPELNFIVFNRDSAHRGRINSKNDRFKRLLRILHSADQERVPILIYVATTVEADQLAKRLQVAGHDARAYHGKMETPDRTSVQEMFMDDHINIVVCTKAFGMGVDKPDIRYVIHYHMPSDIESYYQEAGRAGRDGKPAYCILLHHKSDLGIQEYFIDNGTPDEAVINHVLSALRSLPDNRLFLDPQATEEELGLDSTQLKVALHQLESHQFIERSGDFSLTGMVQLDRPIDPTAPTQLRQLAQADNWQAHQRIEINTLDLFNKTGIAPTAIDDLLLKLDQAQQLLFRPWRRGFVIDKSDKMRRTTTVEAGTLAAERHRADMTRKLQQMVNYAQQNARCRRKLLLDYFGEETADRCDGCDVCQPERAWPWSLVSDRDYATPDAFIDPAFVILEAIAWNLKRADYRGAPYGAGMLLAILRGDGYYATQHIDEPHMKRWRLQQMRDCPQWGALALLPSQKRVVGQFVNRLQSEDYITEAEFQFEQRAYTYFDLRPRGWEQLAAGKLLQWEVQ